MSLHNARCDRKEQNSRGDRTYRTPRMDCSVGTCVEAPAPATAAVATDDQPKQLYEGTSRWWESLALPFPHDAALLVFAMWRCVDVAGRTHGA